MTNINRAQDLVEVKTGELAKAGDIVMVSGNEYQLSEGEAEIHNMYELEGYSKDSRKRFRLTNKQEQTSREAFEEEMRSRDYPIIKTDDGDYCGITQYQWLTWQAATQWADR